MDAAHPPLTERQREVLERIVQRKAYKVIAAELDISETRVKQHVRTIKQRLDANSMAELVAHFHAISPGPPFTQGRGPKMEVSQLPVHRPLQGLDDPGAVRLADSVTMELTAPWKLPIEPRIVPGKLDGEHAGLPRLLAILGIVIGLLAAFVLALTTAGVLTEELRGSGYTVKETQS
jgi:DNA-binding CsgD family transcriptional regulator